MKEKPPGRMKIFKHIFLKMKFLKKPIPNGKLKVLLFLLLVTVIIYLFKSFLSQRSSNYMKFNSKWKEIQRTTDLQVSKCLTWMESLGRSDITDNSPEWIRLHPQLYVYSSYLDDCPFLPLAPKCIKIVAVILKDHSLKQDVVKKYCYLKDTLNRTRSVPVTFEELPEHHSKCYRTFYIYCHIESSINFVTPTHYSIQLSNYPNEIQWMPVLSPYSRSDLLPPKKNNSTKLAVCVRPFFDNFKSLTGLTQFIGYYQSLDVNHFVFYNYSISQDVDNFLVLLRNKSVSFSLRQWNLPFDDFALHSSGQLAHIQDCLLYTKKSFDYTIFVDLDEFIVPHYHSNLREMLNYLDAAYPMAGSYIFPNVMFCDEFMKLQDDKLPYSIQNNLIRQKTSWAYKTRSKTIVKANFISVGGIHFMWNHTHGTYEVFVPSNIGLLHHYRSCLNLLQPYFLYLLNFSPLEDGPVMDQRLLDVSKNFNNTSSVKAFNSLWNTSLHSRCKE